jgi:hypothetical protein
MDGVPVRDGQGTVGVEAAVGGEGFQHRDRALQLRVHGGHERPCALGRGALENGSLPLGKQQGTITTSAITGSSVTS